MSPPEAPTTDSISRRVSFGVLGAVLALQCLYVLWPFLSPQCWALVLSYVTWPVYVRIRRLLGRFTATAALLMTVLVACAVVVPVLWLVVLSQEEFLRVYQVVSHYATQGPHTLPAAVRDVPWVGSRLQEAIDRYAVDPTALEHQIVGWLQRMASHLPGVLGFVGGNLGRLGLTVFTLFFLYRDGEKLVEQATRISRRLFGDRLDPYLRGAGTMTRAVLFGVLVTAIAQGAIAGIGYAIIGLEAPVLLATLTAVLSVFPVFGTAFVWGPLAIWLVLTDQTWRGVALLAWGFVLVHPTDNLLRPVLISSAARVPFLLVMLGALGGLAAYGLIGVFVGPVLMGAAVAIWREWAGDR